MILSLRVLFSQMSGIIRPLQNNGSLWSNDCGEGNEPAVGKTSKIRDPQKLLQTTYIDLLDWWLNKYQIYSPNGGEKWCWIPWFRIRQKSTKNKHKVCLWDGRTYVKQPKNSPMIEIFKPFLDPQPDCEDLSVSGPTPARPVGHIRGGPLPLSVVK